MQVGDPGESGRVSQVACLTGSLLPAFDLSQTRKSLLPPRTCISSSHFRPKCPPTSVPCPTNSGNVCVPNNAPSRSALLRRLVITGCLHGTAHPGQASPSTPTPAVLCFWSAAAPLIVHHQHPSPHRRSNPTHHKQPTHFVKPDLPAHAHTTSLLAYRC